MKAEISSIIRVLSCNASKISLMKDFELVNVILLVPYICCRATSAEAFDSSPVPTNQTFQSHTKQRIAESANLRSV